MKKAQWLIRSTHEEAQPKTMSMPLQKLPHPNHRITVLEVIVSLSCQALIGFIPCLQLVILELVVGAKLLDLLGDIDPPDVLLDPARRNFCGLLGLSLVLLWFESLVS